MKCPLDGAELLITERQGVEIDYCPNCRGVWLDRGELDKLIDRAESYDRRDRSRDDDDDDRRDNYRRAEPRRAEPRREEYAPRSSSVDLVGAVGDVLKKKMADRNSGGNYPHKKKKGGLLGELFDF